MIWGALCCDWACCCLPLVPCWWVCQRSGRNRLCIGITKGGTSARRALAHRVLAGRAERPEHGVLRLRGEARGAPLGKVLAGKYAYADRSAGRHDVLVTELMFPGDSKREVMMESGRTHFTSSRAVPGTMLRQGERYSAAWPGLRSFPSRRPARRIPVRRSSSHSTKRPRERSSPSCRPSSRMRIIAATRPWSRAG